MSCRTDKDVGEVLLSDLLLFDDVVRGGL
jgi:hypothetical protein